jgi:hypothetical protein
MTFAAERLQCAEPKLHGIAMMILDVVDDVCRYGAAFSPAGFAQRLRPKLVAPSSSPASMVVGAASVIAALAAAFGMQLVHGAHGGGCWHSGGIRRTSSLVR